MWPESLASPAYRTVSSCIFYSWYLGFNMWAVWNAVGNFSKCKQMFLFVPLVPNSLLPAGGISNFHLISLSFIKCIILFCSSWSHVQAHVLLSKICRGHFISTEINSCLHFWTAIGIKGQSSVSTGLALCLFNPFIYELASLGFSLKRKPLFSPGLGFPQVK